MDRGDYGMVESGDMFKDGYVELVKKLTIKL